MNKIQGGYLQPISSLVFFLYIYIKSCWFRYRIAAYLIGVSIGKWLFAFVFVSHRQMSRFPTILRGCIVFKVVDFTLPFNPVLTRFLRPSWSQLSSVSASTFSPFPIFISQWSAGPFIFSNWFATSHFRLWVSNQFNSHFPIGDAFRSNSSQFRWLVVSDCLPPLSSCRVPMWTPWEMIKSVANFH